jgi:hypothetical protein
MEKKKYKNSEINRLRLKAENELIEINGVIGVGCGFKEIGGQTKKEKVLRVYVHKKKPLSHLKNHEIIPFNFGGLKIDVCEINHPIIISHCHDLGGHSIVVGGINIMALPKSKIEEWEAEIRSGVNEPDPISEDLAQPIFNIIEELNTLIDGPDGPGISLGTAGGIFRINIEDRDNIAILTNHHVLDPAINGDIVYNFKLEDNDVRNIIKNQSKIKEYAHNRKKLLENTGISESLKMLINNYKFTDFIESIRYGNVFLKEPTTTDYSMVIKEHGEVPLKYYIDCAYVHIDTDYSKSCKKYKGVKFSDQIIKLNINDNKINKFTRVRSLTCKDIGRKVFKVGGRTGMTEGIILDVFGMVAHTTTNGTFEQNLEPAILLVDRISNMVFPSEQLNEIETLLLIKDNLPNFQLKDVYADINLMDQLEARLICEFIKEFKTKQFMTQDEIRERVKWFFENQEVYNEHANVIIIKSTTINCEGKNLFSDRGDSGSLLITEQNELVGLIYAKESEDDNANVYACHIKPVLEYLNLKPLFTANSRSKINHEIVSAENFDAEENITYEALKSKIVNLKNGSFLNEMIQKHANEVVQLVHHKRPVTVTWHRNKGPAFVAHFEKSFKDPNYIVPQEINGITIPFLFHKMGIIMHEHGSALLKHAIQDYAVKISNSVANCNNLEKLLTNICNYKQDE